MGNKIKGLTIEIGGETTALNKALGEVNKHSRDLKAELKDVERLLKLDPTNTELLSQKQKILAESISNTKTKLDTLKDAEKQAQEQFRQGKIGEEQYRAIQQEVIKTEQELKKMEKTLKEMDWKKTAEGLDSFGKKATTVGKTLSTTVTAPILGVGAAGFKMAADLEDAFGATDQIFKGAAGEVKKWADSLESYYGIAESEALEYSNTMGAMLQNIGGLSEQEVAKQSQILVELAGDLTAMFGGTTESAVQALTGALKGNTSMLDNYGMGVNDATIKTKALEMGLYDGTGQMDLASKQAATLALIMEQTADAQGQAGREAEGASGSMRALVTELKNLATDIGEVLLPIITPFIAALKDMAAGFGELSPTAQTTIVVIAGLAAAIGPVLLIIGKFATAISAIITLFGAGGAAAGVIGTAIAALTGPIGIAIAAITAMIAIGVALYKNWDVIKVKAVELMNKISETWDNLKTKTSEAWDNIKTAISDTISGLLTDVIEWGKNIVTGLWNGMSEKIEWLKEKVTGFASDIAQSFKDFFGIESPSTLMAEYGMYIGQGLAQGVEDNAHLPINALKSVANEMVSMAQDTIKQITWTLSQSANAKDWEIITDGPGGKVSYSKSASDILKESRKRIREKNDRYEENYERNNPGKNYQEELNKAYGVTQNITINSPKALSPSEVAKEAAKQSMKLVLPLLR